MTLHQSPHSIWPVGWFPLRPEEWVRHNPVESTQNGTHTSVNDEVGIESVGLELGSEVVDIALLVANLVLRGVRRATIGGEGVEVGHVGRQSANGSGRLCVLVDLAKEFSGGADIGRPAQPSGVTCGLHQ